MFAFPLHLGAIRIGMPVLYRDQPGGLTAEELARGLVLADVASQVVLALQAGAHDGTVHEVLAGEPAHWVRSALIMGVAVCWDTGLLSDQLARGGSRIGVVALSSSEEPSRR